MTVLTRLAHRRRPGRTLAAMLAAGMAALLGGFAWFLAATAAMPAEPGRPTDGIAVLTGGAERVETGLRLFLGGGAAALLISGVHPDATLADLSRAAGLAPDALAEAAGGITLGRAAASTRGNAAEVAAWAVAGDHRSVRVVTAAYHMPRALLELRRTLPGTELLPYPVAARQGWGRLATEYAKLLFALTGLPRPVGAPDGAV